MFSFESNQPLINYHTIYYSVIRFGNREKKTAHCSNDNPSKMYDDSDVSYYSARSKSLDVSYVRALPSLNASASGSRSEYLSGHAIVSFQNS